MCPHEPRILTTRMKSPFRSYVSVTAYHSILIMSYAKSSHLTILVTYLALLSSGLNVLASAQACYNSAGLIPSTDGKVKIWVPCNNNTANSACCCVDDYCMSNGLCLDTHNEDQITQQGCTDPQWSDVGCIDYCGKRGM